MQFSQLLHKLVRLGPVFQGGKPKFVYKRNTTISKDAKRVNGYSSSKVSVPKPLLEMLRNQYFNSGNFTGSQARKLTNHQLVLCCLIHCVDNIDSRNALFQAFDTGGMTPVRRVYKHEYNAVDNNTVMSKLVAQNQKLEHKLSVLSKRSGYNYRHMLNVLYSDNNAVNYLVSRYIRSNDNPLQLKNSKDYQRMMNSDLINKLVDISYQSGVNQSNRVREKFNTKMHRFSK